MSTRSGKTYENRLNEPKRSKKKNNVKDTTFDGTASKDTGADNLDVSSLSTRDLRSRRSSIKDSTFDKSNSSITKNEIENATDSNWIISDLSSKQKRRKSNVNTHLNGSITAITNGHIEKESEIELVGNGPTKRLRTRKTSVANNTFDKNDKVNTTFEKEMDKTFEKEETVTVSTNIKKKGKNKTIIMSETNVDKDTEQDKTFEKDETTTVTVNNKKKGKNQTLILNETNIERGTDEIIENDETETISVNTKKKGKRKTLRNQTDIEKDEEPFDKDETVTVPVNKKKSKNKKPVISETNIEKDTETDKMEKDETVTVTGQKKGKNKPLVISEINIERDTENDLNSPNVAGQQIKKKKKKVKGGKKKKQKGKSKEDAGDKDLYKEDKILDTTFDKDAETKDISMENVASEINENNGQKDLILNTSTKKILRSNKSNIKDTTFEKDDKNLDTTFDKNENIGNKEINSSDISKVNVTVEKNDKSNDTFEKDASTSFDTFKRGAKTRKSSIQEDYKTSNHSSPKVENINLSTTSNSAVKTRKSLIRQTAELNNSSPKKLNSTFDKSANVDISQSIPASNTGTLNTTFDKEISKSSLISSDNSVSRISITSDESAENIMNTTPVLVESSLDVSKVTESSIEGPKSPIEGPKSPKEAPKSPKEAPKSPKEAPKTPLKREGTFTKDAPEVQSPRTPGRSRPSLTPAAGCTPYHIGKSSQKKPMLNITRSIEKRMSVDAPRLTRVMFCSPVDNPVTAGQEKRKIIKSNLKGSNKSFVFDESACISRPGRKRSYTQSDADDARAKRSRLAEDLQQSVDRLSRPRTASTAKPSDTTPKKPTIPFKSKSESKPSRTKLPNFAALHQRQFDKMESLGECQERKAKRAKQMLTPTGSKNLLERISPTNTTDNQKPTTKDPPKPKDKTDTPTKKLPTLESLRPGFTRFGFKLNLDFNPFSVPPKTDKPKEKPNGLVPRPVVLPSVTGATSVRREVAKQTVMREKSLLSKRKLNRNENRTIIKGVRTNRRFELQMKLRNVE